jgi:hypothetical protein
MKVHKPENCRIYRGLVHHEKMNVSKVKTFTLSKNSSPALYRLLKNKSITIFHGDKIRLLQSDRARKKSYAMLVKPFHTLASRPLIVPSGLLLISYVIVLRSMI